MQTFVCKLNKDDPPLGSSSLHVNSHLSLFQENGAKWRADDKERGTTPNPSLRSAAHFCAVLSMNRRVWTQRKNYRGNKLVDDRMFRGCCVQRDDSKWETSKLPALLSRQAKDWEKKIKKNQMVKRIWELTTRQFCRCLWDTGSHCSRPTRETAWRDDPFCGARTWGMRKLGKVTWPEGVPCRHLVFPSIFVCFTQRSLPNYALTFFSNMILLEINNRIIEETLRAKFSA